MSGDTTFDIREGQLVRYFHDRPEDAAPIEDRAACLEVLGFEEEQTGGGCTALMLSRDDEHYLLITSPADATTPEAHEPASVGAYDENGDPDREAAFGSEDAEKIEDTEIFPLAANEVLYERIIAWLSAESQNMSAALSYGGTA